LVFPFVGIPQSKIGALNDNGGHSRTHTLGTGSPAIDAGSNTDCGSYDQRGFTGPIQLGPKRQVDGNKDGIAMCDIGAFEARTSVFLPMVMR
jgi:hypothetical protein